MADTVETAVYRLRVEGQAEIDRLTRSVDGLAVAEEKATASNRTFSQSLQNNLARIDPLVRAQEQYRKALETNARYRESGVGTEAQLSAQLEASTRRYQQQVAVINQVEKATVSHTNAQKLQGYQMLNLSRQIQDVGVSLFSGQSPIMVLAQQLPQIADISQQSGISMTSMFRQAGAAALAFVTPVNVAIGAVAALAAGAAYAALQVDKLQVSSQRAIGGAGAKTGTTVEDINRFSQQQAAPFGSGTGLSQVETRKLAEGLTATGDIVISKLHDMGTAVMGFANQTNKSVDDAIKDFIRFGQDPVKGLEELEKAFGPVSNEARKLVSDLAAGGDKTGAFQAGLDAVSEKARAAAENMGVLEKATRAAVNALATPVRGILQPQGPEQRLEAARQALSKQLETAPDMLDPESIVAYDNELKKLNKTFEDTFAAMQKIVTARMADQFNDLAKKSGEATAALTPQIAQIEALTQKINQLEAAKAAGAASRHGAAADQAALDAARQQKQVLEESQAAAARVTEEVNRIREAHKGVSTEVALTLDGLEKQTALAGAVGGAEKLAAQYAVDYAAAKRAGANATEAAAIASEKQAATQAAINAQGEETLFSLQNQAAAAAAVTGAEQMAAQAAATYNQMVHDGVDASIARAAAAQQSANAEARATANVYKQVKALEQSTELMIAQQNGTEATVKAAQAYTNAIESGASAMSANALWAATLTNELTKAAIEADKIALAAQQKQYADARARGAGTFQPDPTLTTKTGANALTPYGEALRDYQASMQQMAQNTLSFSDQVARMGNVGSALAFAMGQQARGATYGQDVAFSPQGDVLAMPNTTVMAQAISESDIIGQVTSLYDLQRSQGGDQAASMQAEMAWLQSRPQSLEQQRAIVSLKQAMEQLTKSTDQLNATNQDLLSPYYTQDPRTSHIGFRSQGMALGGFVDVPGGVSSNDNMIATIPVASGERIYIDPMTNRRGASGGSGSNSIVINSPIYVQGNVNREEFGRTLFQSNQALAKQIGAATAR